MFSLRGVHSGDRQHSPAGPTRVSGANNVAEGAQLDSAEFGPRAKARWRTRLGAAAVLSACLAVLWAAWRLDPDSRGYGTHEQLGLEPCGFLIATGYPCPTCGMTTAFSLAIRGQLWQAFCAQPAGLMFSLALAAVAVVSLAAVITGCFPRWATSAAADYRTYVAVLAVMLGGWLLKIAIGLAKGTLPVR